MSEFVKTVLDENILTLTLTRPEKKNALTNEMYQALADALERAEEDASIRVILLQGDGDSFTAGNDMADFATQSKAPLSGKQVVRFLKKLAFATKPLIAAVQGNAVGIGATMLLHCDLVYLAPNAKLITPFVNIALIPEAASTLLLQARIGYVRAFEMFALGEPVDAAKAVSLGLANAVVPLEEIRAQSRRAALALVKRPAGSLSLTKALMRDTEEIFSQINRELPLLEQRLASADAAEAMIAFAERRAPNFSKG